MMSARPTWMKAFDVQMGLWRLWSELDVEGFIADRLARGEYAQALREGVAAARKTVLLADPFFITAEMCDLVEAAAATFNPEPLLATDLLTPCGFLLFERPIDVLNGEPGDQFLVPYAGFSWIGVKRHEAGDLFAVALTTYLDWQFRRGGGDGLPDVHELEPWRFGVAAETRHVGWWRLAQATLRLMLEFKPASRYSMRPDRAARREARRGGFEERDVTVVRLRRLRSDAEPLGGSANYSHRFLVSGHWRNQWCPSINAHRQTWISPYVKGPADKPLVPKHGRAFVLNR